MMLRALMSAVQDTAGSYVRRIVFYGVAAIAAMVAVGFLSAALYIYLRYWYGGFIASIWLAVIYGVIAVLAVAVAASTRSHSFAKRAERIVSTETELRAAQMKAAIRGAEEALRTTGREAVKTITPTGLLAAGLASGFAMARWLRHR